jgi:uroporphyrinogen III methyltransferase / synthase
MKPLAGIRVAVTRAANQAADLAVPLEEAGAAVLRCPLIRIEPYAMNDEMRSVLATIDEFDWLIFTSINGVERFMELLPQANIDASSLRDKRIACVGSVTAAAAERAGLAVAAVPSEFTGGALAGALIANAPIRGCRVLLARASGGGQQLPADLEDQGALVVELELYRSVIDASGATRLVERIRAGEIDVVTFTSGSAVNYFVESVKTKTYPVVAVIGPSTAQVARDHGLAVDIEADPHTTAGLVTAIVNYCAAHRGIWRSDAGK